MPTEKTKDYFAFSVATKKGTSSGGFGELMNEIVGSRIRLHSLSAFVSGRRTKVFCVPDDSETFRAFAKKRGLRISRKSASVCTGDSRQALAMLNKWAISGELPPVFNFSSRGEAFIYRALYTGPQ